MVAAIEQAGFNIVNHPDTGKTCLLVSYHEPNSVGERLEVLIMLCTDPGGAKSLPALWYKSGKTPKRLAAYWWLFVTAFDSADAELDTYNPCNDREENINFAWLLEATPENLYRLLAEVKRRFLACEK